MVANSPELPHLHGVVPPLATPLRPDESVDAAALARLVEFVLGAGVHGLWALGTTGRFDLLPDASQRIVAETVAEASGGRVPLVLNVSDQGTKKTLARAAMFDDLPYDYYTALPPWFFSMTPAEVIDYFTALADGLSKPLVIYNAPWVVNRLTLAQLRQVAQHPRIVGCKDGDPGFTRTLDWPVEERRQVGFSYLHAYDQMALSAQVGADGFVSAMGNPFPELCVAIWDAVRADDAERAFRLQTQLTRLAQAFGNGPLFAVVEAFCRHRGLFDRMLPAPLRSLDADASARVAAIVDAVGVRPDTELART
ncbi:dihydrodipicolinate synthase family protein [Tundrisphaera sp. TA3]|uniref:dihydrodipicolinate synthase family protein n=1 Tax=Tundrisphaera sp. TA3 TaxID=3435775 RepID=UPI003EB7E3D6